ncbi:MAG: hypothetical protein IT327_32415 [Anaerolineae bacterium]|nr:hypothetical protein [Anaerolineae bacterium]
MEPDPNAQAQFCAEMVLAETRSLMVNRMAAAIAAQYTAVFVLQRHVLHMGTMSSLNPPSTRSRPITPSTLNPFQL